jgi:nitrogen regulatory protein P-II 1
MIMIEAVVREEKFEAIMAELSKADINGVTVFQVMGWGQQKGFTEHVRSLEVEVRLVPKILFKIAVSTQEEKNKAIDTIRSVAFTGSRGDGKIFTHDLQDVIRIRTGETNTNAL